MEILFFKTPLIQLVLIYQRALTLSNFLIFAPLRPYKDQNQAPIGTSDDNLYRYWQKNIGLILPLFYYFALITEQSWSIAFIL